VAPDPVAPDPVAPDPVAPIGEEGSPRGVARVAPRSWGLKGLEGMRFEGDAEDVPLLLAAACVGDRRRVESLVLWQRVSKSYRSAVHRALQEWCAHQYADAQRAYVDAVLAIGASPAPSPLAMPRARAALVSLCEEAFGREAVTTFGPTVLLCGKMDAQTYMCVQESKCRLCDTDMIAKARSPAASTCQEVERAFRTCLIGHRFLSEKTSLAPSFTFAHVHCQMAHCRPFWSAAAYDQPVWSGGEFGRHLLQVDSVWGVGLPMLLDADNFFPALGSAEAERVRKLAYRAFQKASPSDRTHLPRSMRSDRVDTPGPHALRGDDADELKYAKATSRVQAVLRTDAFGQIHSEANALQLQDCHNSAGSDSQRLRVCAAPRRLHMAWVLPHPAVRLEDTLMGGFADDARVYRDLQVCLRERLKRAEAVVVRWETKVAQNAERLMDFQSELDKLPGMPSDALDFFDSVHSGALCSLGVVRLGRGKWNLVDPGTRLLKDLHWLFVPNEWERHVALDGDRASFVASHAEKVRLLLRRARVTTLEALHDRDALHPRHAVTLKHDAAAWKGALWVLDARLSARERGVVMRHFVAGLGSGFAASDACYALHRQAYRAALDWLFDNVGGFGTLVQAVGDDVRRLATADVDPAGAACVLGKILASLHHTSCAMRVVGVSACDKTHQLKARIRLTVVPRLCRGIVVSSARSFSFLLPIVELEGELSFALSEAAGREGPQWRELESAAAALLTRPPEWSAEWVARDVDLAQRAIDALLCVGFEDNAPRRVRTSALRISRIGSVLLCGGPLTTAERRRWLHEQQQRACVHYPNACACRPVLTLGPDAPSAP